jgi:hypothetical protein
MKDGSGSRDDRNDQTFPGLLTLLAASSDAQVGAHSGGKVESIPIGIDSSIDKHIGNTVDVP